MLKLVFVTIAPCNRIFGNKLDPYWFQENGFQVEFWDLSALYHDEHSIKAYFAGADGYMYKGPGHRFFQSRREVADALAGLGSSDIVWHMSRTSYTLRDDYWLLRLLRIHNMRYVICEFENKIQGVAEHASLSKRLLNVFAKVCEFRGMLGRIMISRIKDRLMRRGLWYQMPAVYIGAGRVAERRYRLVFPRTTEFISIPSPLVDWSRPKGGNSDFHLFVDESIAHAPDSKLFKRNICTDFAQYFDNLNHAFSRIEAETGKPVVIGASGKVDYKEDVFAGRKLVYGKTLSLIEQADLVIGHASSGLFQAVVSRKSVLILDDPTFTETKQRDVRSMANFFRVEPILSTELLSEDVARALTMDASCLESIEEDYFRSKGVDGDWHEIVARGLNELFSQDSQSFPSASAASNSS